jgi:hypothetical protein
VDTSNDTTGRWCDLAFDSTGNGHLIYFNETHPSIWYGAWNGSTWTTQLVDGLGFNTGGIVHPPMELVVDAAGKPHIVYTVEGKGVWYATLSGNTWTRERVDTASLPPEYNDRIAITLDPANGNRPTIVYTWYGNVTNVGNVRRLVVAYRTGPNAWTTAMVTFPLTYAYYDQDLRGEILFDPSGTLYIPFSGDALGTWKPSGTIAFSELPGNLFYYDGSQVSMARTGAGHLLLRAGRFVVDVTPGNPQPVATFALSNIEADTSSLGDLIFAGGKPQEILLHGYSLELVAPDANNYWVYTSVGTAASNYHISLAQRPTTGTLHYCFQSGSKVMFQ